MFNKEKKYTLQDCIDQDYNTLELPEDFLYDEIALMYRDDPCIKVVNDPIFYQDMEMSSIRVFDFRNDTVHVGAKELINPIYYFKENFAAVDLVLDFADDLLAGLSPDFPDLPDAKPIIPSNQHMRSEEMYMVETEMMRQGCVIVNPSVGFVKEDPNMFVATEDENSSLPHISTIDNKEVLFYPYHRVKFKDEKYKDKKIICMEFNPFHPMSIHVIDSMEWSADGMCVFGKYRYKERLKSFSYSLKSRAYRISSYIWLQMLRYKYDAGYEMYDLVSNFSFASFLKYHFKDKQVNIEPLIIEPVIFKSYPRLWYRRRKIDISGVPMARGQFHPDAAIRVFPYSLMTTNRVVGTGTRKKIFCTYMDKAFPIEEEQVMALDVTSDCVIRDSVVFFHDRSYPIHKNELVSETLYLKMRDNKLFRVFLLVNNIVRGDEGEHIVTVGGLEYAINSTNENLKREDLDKFDHVKSFYRFVKCEAKFYSFPRNNSGSLIYTMRCVTLQGALRLRDTEFHQYFPLMAPGRDDDEIIAPRDYRAYVSDTAAEEEMINFQSIHQGLFEDIELDY